MSDTTKKAAPTAFISHASEDKSRFAEPFARRLRENSVDAWLDKWEMATGDSLVQRLFEEGLKGANVFIIVLSNNSVGKPWVRKELDTAIVRSIKDTIKIIPIVLDDCEVPESLKSILYTPIKDINNYDAEFNAILASIFNYSEKPPLGEPPAYARAVVNIPDLNAVDSSIFKAICDTALESGRLRVTVNKVMPAIKTLGISDEVFIESLQMLSETGYIETNHPSGRHIGWFTVTPFGFQQYAQVHLPQYDAQFKDVVAKLLNSDRRDVVSVSEATSTPVAFVEHVFETLKGQGHISTVASIGGPMTVVSISIMLKRWLEEQS